jgi:hypothetical protein
MAVQRLRQTLPAEDTGDRLDAMSAAELVQMFRRDLAEDDAVEQSTEA